MTVGDDRLPLLDGLSAAELGCHGIAGQLVRRHLQHGDVEMIVDIDPIGGNPLAFGIADRIAIIDLGTILFIGTPEQVKANSNPLIQQFITADFKKEALSL